MNEVVVLLVFWKLVRAICSPSHYTQKTEWESVSEMARTEHWECEKIYFSFFTRKFVFSIRAICFGIEKEIHMCRKLWIKILVPLKICSDCHVFVMKVCLSEWESWLCVCVRVPNQRTNERVSEYDCGGCICLLAPSKKSITWKKSITHAYNNVQSLVSLENRKRHFPTTFE